MSDDKKELSQIDYQQPHRKKKLAMETRQNRKSRRHDNKLNQKMNQNENSSKDSKQRQEKLTMYFNLGIKQNSQTHPPQSDLDFKLNNLQEELKTQNLLIQQLKKDKVIQQNKYSQLYSDKKIYSTKAKHIIAQTIKQIANIKRKERLTVDHRFGYFKDNGFKTFIEGQDVTNLKEKIKQKITIINKLQADKKSKKNDENTQRINFSIEFIKKQIDQLNQLLKIKQNEVNQYKERIKLAQKESMCRYALQNWPIVKQRYQTLQMLGSGGFGEVYKCFDLETNQYVALKVNKFSLDKGDEYKEQFMKHIYRQIKTQQNLNHPNIAKFIDLIETTQSGISFVLEYCSGPQLSKYLRKHHTIEEKQAKGIIRQILCALNYLYSLETRIIHYDLKPSNIIFHNGVIKILDFGLCKLIDNDETRMQLTSQGVGTYWYLPPETFDQWAPTISSKVDIWSVGVIFFQMLYGRKPFGHGLSQTKIYNEGVILKATTVDFPVNNKQIKVSDAAKEFILSCLRYKADDRLKPDEAYYHPYFTK